MRLLISLDFIDSLFDFMETISSCWIYIDGMTHSRYTTLRVNTQAYILSEAPFSGIIWYRTPYTWAYYFFFSFWAFQCLLVFCYYFYVFFLEKITIFSYLYMDICNWHHNIASIFASSLLKWYICWYICRRDQCYICYSYL